MLINKKNTKFLIILFCFSIFSSISQTNESVPFNNIAVNETPKPISQVIFEDFLGNKINLKDYYGKLIIINFWAIWCAPCKEEMPSLDNLQSNAELDNLKIFPINIGREDLPKSESFFKELKIKNLEIYFDAPITLAKKFALRGVPTTIIFNKEGKEFARIIGSIDFNDEDFINWLKLYN